MERGFGYVVPLETQAALLPVRDDRGSLAKGSVGQQTQGQLPSTVKVYGIPHYTVKPLIKGTPWGR